MNKNLNFFAVLVLSWSISLSAMDSGNEDNRSTLKKSFGKVWQGFCHCWELLVCPDELQPEPEPEKHAIVSLSSGVEPKNNHEVPLDPLTQVAIAVASRQPMGRVFSQDVSSTSASPKEELPKVMSWELVSGAAIPNSSEAKIVRTASAEGCEWEQSAETTKT